MSLGIVVKGPEGLVMAADSRVTLTAVQADGRTVHVNYDNATKLLSFNNHTHVGVVTYGAAAIGLRSAASYLSEFEAVLDEESAGVRIPVLKFAEMFSKFFVSQWDEWQRSQPKEYQGPSMTFVVAGFDEGEPYGKIYLIEIPHSPEPVQQHVQAEGFGITWGGQRECVDRLFQGFDQRLIPIVADRLSLESDQIEKLQGVLQELQVPIPLPALPLQDCVDLAIFAIRTTIGYQKLTVGVRGVGGPIDVATITRNNGLRFVQRKEISGELET